MYCNLVEYRSVIVIRDYIFNRENIKLNAIIGYILIIIGTIGKYNLGNKNFLQFISGFLFGIGMFILCTSVYLSFKNN